MLAFYHFPFITDKPAPLNLQFTFCKYLLEFLIPEFLSSIAQQFSWFLQLSSYFLVISAIKFFITQEYFKGLVNVVSHYFR